MFSRVVPELMTLASTSTMSSKHAAAVMSGRRVLSTAINYPLLSGAGAQWKTKGLSPVGELVGFATKATTSGHFGCCHTYAQYRQTSTSTSTFDEMYQRPYSSNRGKRNGSYSYDAGVEDARFEAEYVRKQTPQWETFRKELFDTRREKCFKVEGSIEADGVGTSASC